MRLIRNLTMIVLMMIAHQVYAEQGEFSVGVGAIIPNGLTAKYWTTDNVAIDVFGEWSINAKEYHTHVDVLIHDFNKIQWEGERIAQYFGVGGAATFKEDDDTRVLIRVPIGVAYYMSDVPVELFAETAPLVSIYPSTNFHLDLMVGARYRFL